ncbi:MAG: isochorismatase family protein [Verrucomicrobiota bacterium]
MSASSLPPPDDTLLLCVDMQVPFFRVIPDVDRLQRRCEFAISCAVGLGMPVAFTEQVPEKLGHTSPALASLAPQASFWGKNTFSAFADDGIRDAIIRQRNIQHILLCGIETPVCVYQTAIAALADDLNVTVLSDAVAARRNDDARVCLDALIRAGVHVLPSETVFYALLHDVGHPFFRSYTQLVKSAS